MHSNATNVNEIQWKEALEYFCKETQTYCTNDMIHTMEPNFSTSTTFKKSVYHGIIMGTLKKYFSFSVGLLCGIYEG